ncbi:MAG TPA: MMPL family transporter [Myxococcota bacterium]|nr:MMPL family transporter [Myxococcota bacterium]
MAATEREGGAGAIGAINRAFAALAGWCFDHRWVVIALSVAIVAGGTWLIGSPRIDNSYEAFFAPGDPSYRAYLSYRDDFGSDEISYLMYEAPDAAGGVFDLAVMERIARLTKALEDEVPFVYEVKSVTNAELIEPTDDGIRIRRVWRDFAHTQEAMDEARALFLSKPLYVGGLVTGDARFGALSIKMDRSSTDPPEQIRLDPNGGDSLGNLYPQVTSEKIEEIIARPDYAGLRFYHSGDVPMNTAYNRIIEREDDLLMMISLAVIAAVLAVFVRTVVGVVGPLLVVVIAVIGTTTFIAARGWKLDMMFGQVPNILVTVGVAEAVHILIEFGTAFRRLLDRRAALVHTMYLLGAPCLLTSLTTAVGFLALQVSPVVAIAHMAVYSAVGVVLAFAFTMTLVPALVSFGPRTPRPRPGARTARAGEQRMHRALAAVAAWNVRHRRAVIYGFAAVSIASAVGIARLRVDSNWLDDFSDRVPLKGATSRIDSVMSGMSNLIYIFDTGKEDGIRDPAVLRAIDGLQREAERDDLVRKTYSIADIVKDLNQSFHDGDPAWFAIPDDRALVSQLLLLYETSGGEDVQEWATTDFARANLELRLGIAPIRRTSDLAAHLDGYLARTPIPGVSVSLSGIGALWLELLDYIVASEIESFLYAFVLIGAMMCFIFRSVKTGMLSMIPNLWPILLTLGAMGWLRIPLDYNKVMIASVAMGIAVDDTIHFVSRCHHEFTERGSYAEALAAAMSDVGHAVAVTSLVLVLGFMVNVFSVLDANAKSGILLATTIATALLADLLLTPALLLAIEPFGPEGERVRRAELAEAA